MRTATRKRALFSATLAAALLGASGAHALAANVAPLPAANYSVHPVCAGARSRSSSLYGANARAAHRSRTRRQAPAPHHLRKQPAQASPTSGAFGLRPSDLHRAYRLPDSAGTTQTIALVDAYDDPHIEEGDLRVYDETFGLPPPAPIRTAALRRSTRTARPARCPSPKRVGHWRFLDVEVAHATCESCHILLVEATSSSYEDLAAAEQTAGRLGAGEISNSWGGPEEGEVPAHYNATAFNQPGVVITASAGDDGYLNWMASEGREVNFPASSPHVVAVGGTRLELNSSDNWSAEAVWNGLGASGGGCSAVFAAPAWQQDLSDWQTVGCGSHRSVADVAADADPYTGVAIYDTSSECEFQASVHWCPIGGTSLASPLIAAVFALAGGAHGVAYPAQTLYANQALATSGLHDITAGSNGECNTQYGPDGVSGCSATAEAAASCHSTLSCLAGSGYNGPAGVGSPNGLAAFEPDGIAPAGGSGEDGGEEPGEAREQPGEASGPSGSGSEAPPSTPPEPTFSAEEIEEAPTAVLSALTLSHGAFTARAHDNVLARVSSVSFTFTISLADHVKAALALRSSSHGHSHWCALKGALHIAAHRGTNSAHMPARGKLLPGIYQLTVTAAGGSARSIVFRVV